MTDQLIMDVGDVVMTVTMLGTAAFAVSYAVFFNWRKTQAGRSLMYFVLALVLWAGLSTFTRLVGGEFPGRPYVRLVVFLAILATVVRLLVVLWRRWRNTPQRIEPRKEKQ